MSTLSAPQVSCVTVFYNRATLVRSSIDTLLAQTLTNIEVIVVDDGSTDNTAMEIAALNDPRLRPISQSNSGFTVAMNRAIRQCRADYIAIHGAGDLSRPERLERQAAYLDAHPGVGVVGCRRIEGGILTGPDREAARGPMFDVMLRRNPFCHGEVMFRRVLFEEVGGYREAFRFAQDRDLWLRMGRLCDYAVLPDLLYEHDIQEGSVSKTPQAYFLQRKLSQFAVQCAQDVDADGRDLLDRLGPSAFFLTRRTPALAHLLTLRGLRALRDGRLAVADFFIDMGWHEHRDAYTLAARGARAASRLPVVAAAVRWLLRRGTRGTPPERLAQR